MAPGVENDKSFSDKKVDLTSCGVWDDCAFTDVESSDEDLDSSEGELDIWRAN